MIPAKSGLTHRLSHDNEILTYDKTLLTSFKQPFDHDVFKIIIRALFLTAILLM